jgi:lactoylglutathione lyase
MSEFIRVVPYAVDALDLPVRDVEAATPHYVTQLGFRLVSRTDLPTKSAILERDAVRIALVENGRDPEQEGAYFEVNDVEAVFEEITGRSPTDKDIQLQTKKGRSQRVFFHIAPDGLCFMFGEPA